MAVNHALLTLFKLRMAISSFGISKLLLQTRLNPFLKSYGK